MVAVVWAKSVIARRAEPKGAGFEFQYLTGSSFKCLDIIAVCPFFGDYIPAIWGSQTLRIPGLENNFVSSPDYQNWVDSPI